MAIDIKSDAPYPANVLSNFYPHKFVFDGVECASMEGLLQAFKFPEVNKRLILCRMSGYDAKALGTTGNAAWQASRVLHWNGIQYNRDGHRYQGLLGRAYDALFQQSEEFRKALMATGDEQLTHSIGSSSKKHSILTEKEFVSRLELLRIREKNKKFLTFFSEE